MKLQDQIKPVIVHQAHKHAQLLPLLSTPFATVQMKYKRSVQSQRYTLQPKKKLKPWMHRFMRAYLYLKKDMLFSLRLQQIHYLSQPLLSLANHALTLHNRQAKRTIIPLRSTDAHQHAGCILIQYTIPASKKLVSRYHNTRCKVHHAF